MRIIKQLREATNNLHRAIEKVSMSKSIISCSLSVDDYKKLIQKNYFIHTKVELAFAEFQKIPSSKQLDYSYHSRLPSLQLDLKTLDLIPPEINADHLMLASLENVSGMLGALYVVEGSSLGNKVIYKHLRKNTFLQEIPEFYFFKNDQIKSPHSWKNFIEIAEKEITDIDSATRAACHLFEFYKKVYEAPLFS